MPYFLPSNERINYLIDTYDEGGFEEAMINVKRNFFYYTTELGEIGPMYVMDDFGNAQIVTFKILCQYLYIYPPFNVLT